MFEKVKDFFWDDVEDAHYEKVKTFEKPEDYNKGMELLVKMKEEENKEQMSNKMDAQTKLGIGQLIMQGVTVGAAVFLGVFAYKSDEDLKMSNGKTWSIGNKLLGWKK